MDHSVQAYLRKLPTETLEKFLEDYRNGRFQEDFANIIGEVLRELERRRKKS